MPAPTSPTNVETVFKCIEYTLNQINNANGYYTDGILIDKSRDPRMVRQNKPEAYRDLHACLTIVTGDAVKDNKVTAGRSRYLQHYALQGIVTLTKDQDAAGIDLNMILARIQRDVKTAFEKDNNFIIASAALNLSRPSCVNHQIVDIKNDQGSYFPDALFQMNCTFIFDESTIHP